MITINHDREVALERALLLLLLLFLLFLYLFHPLTFLLCLLNVPHILPLLLLPALHLLFLLLLLHQLLLFLCASINEEKKKQGQEMKTRGSSGVTWHAHTHGLQTPGLHF